MSRSKLTECCFCGRPCDDLAALKEHSANCSHHPLWADAQRWRKVLGQLAVYSGPAGKDEHMWAFRAIFTRYTNLNDAMDSIAPEVKK